MTDVLVYFVEREGYCVMVEEKYLWGLFTSSYPVIKVGGSKDFVKKQYIDQADRPTFFKTVEEANETRIEFIHKVLRKPKEKPPSVLLMSKISLKDENS